jgi:thiol-disulfide isomerase/thioredoxin
MNAFRLPMWTTKLLVPVLVLLTGLPLQAAEHQHGKITTLSAATSKEYERCKHKVPKEVCTRCNPQLAARFKEAKDWCPEHDVPESQCFKCHPDLTFDPLPALPEKADLLEIAHEGEDVPALEPHAVKGKITVFDFHAVWCAPCRKIDAHVFALLGKREDLAMRKLNVVSWETPLAKRYLKDVSGLPYVVVYGKSGKRVAAVEGLDLKKLDQAIAAAEKQ